MKKIIKTIKAPAPIGPYSQAVMINGFLYVSGQLAINPETNEVIWEDVRQETKQVMENLKTILNEAGFGFDNVVKTTIFLTDMEIFPLVNEVYGSYFTSAFPARETVAVLALPKGVRVEISVIASQ